MTTTRNRQLPPTIRYTATASQPGRHRIIIMNHLCIKWPTPALLLLLTATLSAIVVFDGACRCCLFVEGFSVAAARAVVKPSPLPPLELPATAERCAPSDTPPSSLLSDRCIQRRHVQSPSLFMSNNDLDESTASPSTNDSTTTSSTPSTTSTQPAEIVESSLTSSQITSIQKHMHLGTKLRNLQTQLKSNAASFKPENLSKLGLTALLSYGFVSNVSGVVAVSCAWFIFSKKVSYLECCCCLYMYCCIRLIGSIFDQCMT